jgi:hypothetical protein
MKPIALILPKIKIQRKILINLTIAILVLVVLVGLGYLQKSGKLGEINLGLLLGKLTTSLPEKEEESLAPLSLVEEQLPEEETPAGTKIYEEKAEPGEGITHLARKALKEYLTDKGAGFDLTAEHKIYIEDYIQKKTGDHWLALGENISISEELIVEGINQAKELSPEQLENLKQYSSLIPSL